MRRLVLSAVALLALAGAAAAQQSALVGPLQPFNNLSDLQVASTARGNLGLGTAATQAVGTSGATVPLLNGVNTWSGAAAFSAGLQSTTNFGGGSNYPTYGSGGIALGWNVTSGSAEAALINPFTGPAVNFAMYQMTSASALSRVFTIRDGGGVILPKLSSAPGAAPGAGYAELFFVAGTNAGTCKLQALAGTSTTPVTVLDNIGSGC